MRSSGNVYQWSLTLNKIPIASTIKTRGWGLTANAILAECNNEPGVQKTKSGLDKHYFQAVVNGDSTELYVIHNANGIEVCITNYGGRIVSLMVPDATGKYRAVVQGFAHIDGYTNEPTTFGATIDRKSVV